MPQQSANRRESGRFRKRRLRDLPLRGRRLLLRADLNAPLDGDRSVADDSRLRAALDAVREARDAGAAVVLMSHLGRPGGRPDPALSMRPVADRLRQLTEGRVRFAGDPDPAGEAARRISEYMGPGDTLLLENLRFDPGETANDAGFAARLARLGDLYANDAFGAAHRAHASVEALARRFPAAAAGPLLERELANVGDALTDPPRPFLAILGGAKVSDKLPVLRALAGRADRVLVGGAMACTLLAARGMPVGRSLVEPERIGDARDLLSEVGDRLLLPEDHVAAGSPDDAGPRAFGLDSLPPDLMVLDIGPATRVRYVEEIERARAVFWNGPMGLFEIPRFGDGTAAVARAVGEAGRRGALTVVGGGDSLAAIRGTDAEGHVTHLSTGGGASLALLAGERLPGVEALADV